MGAGGAPGRGRKLPSGPGSLWLRKAEKDPRAVKSPSWEGFWVEIELKQPQGGRTAEEERQGALGSAAGNSIALLPSPLCPAHSSKDEDLYPFHGYRLFSLQIPECFLQEALLGFCDLHSSPAGPPHYGNARVCGSTPHSPEGKPWGLGPLCSVSPMPSPVPAHSGTGWLKPGSQSLQT